MSDKGGGGIGRLWTLEEAALHVRVCSKTLRRAIKCGMLRAGGTAGRIRIAEEDLKNYLWSRVVQKEKPSGFEV